VILSPQPRILLSARSNFGNASNARPEISKERCLKKSKKSQKIEAGADIIELILRDHKPLKALIKTMKSERATYRQKKAAFNEFAPTLIAHAKPEERTWYKNMKSQDDMKVEGLEGDVEHGLADQLCRELKRTKDNDMFEAKVKVLAELVEHHIEEEEEDMLPSFKRKSTKEERAKLGLIYEKFRAEY
jgi:hemerythrin superfamily protein